MTARLRLGRAWPALVLLLVTFGVSAQPAPGYYDTADDSTSTALRQSLHEIIDDHVRYPYTDTSTDTWDILEIADENQDNPGEVITVYRNASYAKAGGGNSFYNREHSWPKSYGFPVLNDDNYPWTDAHHLFIADSGYNSSRSNKPFNLCGSSCSEKVTDVNNGRGGQGGGYPGDSNWTTGSFTAGIWEVWSGRRGDIARALLYMDLRYEGGNHGVTGSPEPDLILTDNLSLIEASNTGSNEPVAYMGLLSVLLDWHQQDPVDLIEFQHHEAVASFQGNRNPFIDHPEWVGCVFQGACSGGGGDTTPPAAPTGLVAVGGDARVDLDWFDNAEADLAGYRVYRSTTSGSGYGQISAGLVTASQWADTSVSNGTTYYYVVAAVDTSGNVSSTSAEDFATPTGSGGGGAGTAWINEFHYDNDGTDTGEFVEVAGPSGTSLAGWSLVAYNGNGGTAYSTIGLSGTLPDQNNGYGTLSFAFTALQNGSPDGIALVDGAGNVVELLSYEGTLTAVDGPAAGLTSIDVGVQEGSATPVGDSLQRTGTGSVAADFAWSGPSVASPGNVNAGQSFVGTVDTTPPAAPGGMSATASETEITVDWADNGEADLAGYNIFRATSAGGPYTQLNGALLAASTYVDAAVNAGETWFYVATAVDASGNESSPGAEVSATVPFPAVGEAWINEFHYDNDGTDFGEFVEVAGPAGTSLAGWSLVGYNGNGGGAYATVSLSGSILDQQNGYGVLAFDFAGLQNGSPDAIALVDSNGSVVEFLSYEGSVTATDGPAAGLVSMDVGVSEGSATPLGYSLQRTGAGTAAVDFGWTGPAADSYGAVNAGQSFGTAPPADTTPPAVPQGLTATGGNRKVDLDWNDNTESDLAGYHVYRATSAGGSYQWIGTTTSSNYSDTGLQNGQTYHYAVTALDLADNESSPSASASATPQKGGGRGKG